MGGRTVYGMAELQASNPYAYMQYMHGHAPCARAQRAYIWRCTLMACAAHARAPSAQGLRH